MNNRTFAVLRLMAIGAFLYFYLSMFADCFIDDAFITFKYAATLRESGTWGFFPGFVANSATSPLNVILLSLISLLTGSVLTAAIWLALACFLLIFIVLQRLSARISGKSLFGYLAFSLLLFNPLLMSTLGLEGIVVTLLLTASLCFQVEDRRYLLAVSLGLLTMTRPEGALFFAVFLMFRLRQKSNLGFVAVYLLTIAPWYLYSWIHLGSLVPDTLSIKTVQHGWRSWWFLNGPAFYLHRYPLATALALISAPLLALLFVRGDRKSLRLKWLLVAIGSAHFLAYCLLHVPPFHWYYVPEVVCIILLASLALSDAFQHAGHAMLRRFYAVLLGLGFALPALGMNHFLQHDRYALKEAPIHTNWATHDRYREIGLWLKSQHVVRGINLDGEIGTVAYYCDCYLLNEFSNREWTASYLARQNKRGIRRLLLRLNFLFFQPGRPLPEATYLLQSSPRDTDTPPGTVAAWDIRSRWIASGHVYLIKVP